ncbi:MAG TPA: hypothetical protein VHD69_02415 [Candidatus Paceibacterota bacterium]|nr:hypothetical protein [Candidatus Paceibacterota bacterium]
MIKRIVILKHGGGELANQLWNYASVLAYGIDANVPVRNPSFYEYHRFFRFLKDEGAITKLRSLFFLKPRRRSSWISRNQRFKYALYAALAKKLCARSVYSSENSENKIVLLPPSEALPARYDACARLYTTGWLFRNPAGFAKHADALRAAFKPTDQILQRVDTIMAPLRKSYDRIIGLHIRQSDYATFKGGKYLVSQELFREIAEEYIDENGLVDAKTAFVIASDGPIDPSKFADLNIYVSKENSVVDLFLLSYTDAIIGSDSSFGAFAAWHGNIPHIIAKKGPMDWSYYAGKTTYFDNTYSELRTY